MVRAPLVVLLLAGTLLPSLVQAQSLRAGWVSPDAARRVGLERMWFGQVQLNGIRDRLHHVRLHVSASEFETIYQVVYQGGELTFAESDIDRYGEVLGKERAQQQAEQAVADLKKQNQEAELNTLLVPDVTLYAIGQGGMVHAMDAETGRTKWTSNLGNPDYLTEAPGASDEHVAVINGITLFVLDAKDGTPLWQEKLDGPPGAGPAVTSRMVFVPMVNGRMQAYPLTDPTPYPEYFQSFGRLVVQPVVTPTAVVWVTDRGHLCSSDYDQMNVRFRLEAHQTMIARPTYRIPRRVFVSSMDGFVYSVDDFNGRIQWRFSTGEGVNHSPVPIGDAVYAVTERGNLFRIAIDTGQEAWVTSGVSSLLAGSADRLYAVGVTGRMEVLDAQTGSRVATLGDVPRLVKFTNTQTDRLYLCSEDGLIQCFRDRQQARPTIHPGWEPPQEQAPESAEEETPATPQEEQRPRQPASTGPFGGDNPFAPGGNQAPPAGPAADPFAPLPGGNPFAPDASNDAVDDPFAP